MGLAARRIRPTEKSRRAVIHRLVKNGDKGLWLYVPHLQDRIRAFCSRYPTEYDGPYLCDLVEANFISDAPCMAVYIALDPNLRLVGHVLIGIEGHGPTTIANILQYEMDPGARIPLAQLSNTMREIEGWASRSGATEIQAQVRNEQLERAFNVAYGFKRLRILINKEL